MPDVFTVFLNEDDDDDDAHRPDPPPTPTPTFPLETNIRDRWASVSNKTRWGSIDRQKKRVPRSPPKRL